jgi:hypothetical protein
MQPHHNFQTLTLPATQRKTGKRQWKPSIQVLEEEMILHEKADASQAARAIGFYPLESGRDSNGRPFSVDIEDLLEPLPVVLANNPMGC